MTKTAAFAILAFTSTALAQYYPEADYGSIYARDAEPEYDDVFDLYSREAEAEPEWELHPRDAYMEGFEAGLYARAVTPKAAAKPPTPQQREQRINNKEVGVLKDENKLNSQMAAQKKEMAKLQAEMKTEGAALKKDQGRKTRLDGAFERTRQQELAQQAKQRRALYDLYDFDY